jgi:hypothetical protein
MGQLAKERIELAQPFINVEADFDGPFLIKEGISPGKVQINGYVSLFI